MTQPMVTICMPTYEPNPLHLKEAIESVLAQTERNWLLFIHDDASRVDVRAMVEPYLNDERITFARSETRLGIGGNWNACLRSVRTPFMQFLFQDDVWDPRYLTSALSIMRTHPSLGFTSLGHEYRMEGEMATQSHYEHLSQLRSEHLTPGVHDGRVFLQWWMERGLHPNVIGEPSFVMMRTTTVLAAGEFLEDMPQGLDMEYWTRLLQISDWGYVPEPHGFFRVHKDSASERNQAAGVGLFDRLRCMEKVMEAQEGTPRERSKKAIGKQLEGMIRKFRTRSQSGQQVNMQGSSAARQFALRHPLLTLRAGLRALSTEERKSK